ncbi:hypothetical protein [Fusobacterium periodonticum]|uniref:Uncharacterized protein n=1 Tax=Fusobacterium periodonticum ATCC 33693 TaxID=546275 RepID=D4CUX2_9FUSO|nr:hypothetical protein [Fusobacterium periodonticum]EFE86882.1 hypothetical protein FUSPEROL_01213 [Fusobacterium periodonticum ATCC 33693]
MANSIQGARNIFDVLNNARKNNQEISKETLKELLLKLIPDEEIRNRLDGFIKGYRAEELFKEIFSLLPWIKVVTPLGQEQFPDTSKEEFQIPDYSVMFEDSQKLSQNILVEVKLVDKKEKLHLQKYKYEVLEKYSKETNIPLIFAIFWKDKLVWTLNSISSFYEKSSEFCISYNQAIKNDLSSIFGDYTYIFLNKIYRKSRYSTLKNIKNDYGHEHNSYGKTVYDAISIDDKIYEKIGFFDSPVLDSIFSFHEINHIDISQNEVELKEIAEKNIPVKLSTWIILYLEKISFYNKEEIFCHENIVVKEVFSIIDNIRVKCGGERFYIIPQIKAKDIDEIFKKQFYKTHVYDCFLENKNYNEKEGICLCWHNNTKNYDF